MRPPSGFRRPRLYTEEGHGERHATWLELFFDLVFVVAVAELAHLLEVNLTLGGLAAFVALFVPIWWQWIDFSYYADQYDTGETSFQAILLAVMFGIIVLALAIPDAFGEGATFFAATYAALRVVIIGLYLWAWRTVDEARELAGRYAASFVVALAVWIVSLFTPAPLRFGLWALALAIEITNGPITYATIRHVPRQVSHMDERFGLFVILVLGEAVIAVATGVGETEWRPEATLTALGGFGIAVTCWWLFFSLADAEVINTALRGDRWALLRSFVYGYSHFFVFAGITAAGVGSAAAIEAAANGELMSLGARAALGGGIAAFLAGAGAVHWAAPRSLHQHILAARLAVAAACIALVTAGGVLSPLTLVGCLLALLAGLGWLEAIHAARRPTVANAAAPSEPLTR